MASPVGSLVVRIGADVGGLQKGGRRAESTMQRMAREARAGANSLAKVGAAATAAGAAITAALTQRGMEAVTAQQRMAKAVGTTNREVAGLTAAFKTYKLQQDDVADALGTLADRAQDAANGQESMADDFRLVGLEVDNLKGKRPAELFRQFSGAIQDTEDPTKRTAAAVRIFGDDLGRKLLPLLMEGPSALKEFRQQAEELGIAVNGIESQQVERANRAIEQMQQVLSGVSNQLAVALAPLVSEVADRFTDAARETGGFKRQIEATVQTGLQGFGKVMDVMRGLRVVVKTIEVAFAGIGWVVNQVMGKVAEAIGGVIDTVWDKINGLIEAMNNLPGVKLPTVEGSAQNYAVIKQLSGAADESSERVARLSGELGDLVDKPMPTENIDKFFEAVKTRSREAAESAKRGTGALPQPGMGGEGDSEQRKKEREKQREHLNKKMEQLRAYLATRRETEVMDFEQRMEWLRNAREKEIITETEFRQRKEKLEDKHQAKLTEIAQRGLSEREKFNRMSMDAQAGQVASSLQQMTASTSRENKRMFELNKAAGIANAIVNTYQGVSQALAAYPPPVSFVMAAAQAAAGFAKVQAIKSQSFGSAGAGGGGSGAPSQTGARTTEQGTGAGEGGGPTREANINLEGDTFSGRQVEQLAEKLNEFSGDNGDLRINVSRAN